MTRVMLAGPCGVGKSTLGCLLAARLGIAYLEFDSFRRCHPESNSLAWSLSRLDLVSCLSDYLDNQPSCVIDIGGDSVFRSGADNNARLAQVQRLRQAFGVVVVLLEASEEAARTRFSRTKGRDPEEFDEPWQAWHADSLDWWKRCADLCIDTTTHSIDVDPHLGALVDQVLAGIEART